jgi:hypothetical protein
MYQKKFEYIFKIEVFKSIFELKLRINRLHTHKNLMHIF